MAVPGRDERDFEFARSVRACRSCRTVATAAPTFDGKARTSARARRSTAAFLDGLGVADAKRKIIDWLDANGYGEGTVTYRLRDWLFSRQRYWGEPFPIVYDETGLPIALPESMLPVRASRDRRLQPPHVRGRRRDVDARAAAGARARLGRSRARPR